MFIFFRSSASSSSRSLSASMRFWCCTQKTCSVSATVNGTQTACHDTEDDLQQMIKSEHTPSHCYNWLPVDYSQRVGIKETYLWRLPCQDLFQPQRSLWPDSPWVAKVRVQLAECTCTYRESNSWGKVLHMLPSPTFGESQGTSWETLTKIKLVSHNSQIRMIQDKSNHQTHITHIVYQVSKPSIQTETLGTSATDQFTLLQHPLSPDILFFSFFFNSWPQQVPIISIYDCSWSNQVVKTSLFQSYI